MMKFMVSVVVVPFVYTEIWLVASMFRLTQPMFFPPPHEPAPGDWMKTLEFAHSEEYVSFEILQERVHVWETEVREEPIVGTEYSLPDWKNEL